MKQYIIKGLKFAKLGVEDRDGHEGFGPYVKSPSESEVPAGSRVLGVKGDKEKEYKKINTAKELEKNWPKGLFATTATVCLQVKQEMPSSNAAGTRL